MVNYNVKQAHVRGDVMRLMSEGRARARRAMPPARRTLHAELARCILGLC